MHKYKSFVAWQRGHELLIATLRATDVAWTPKAKPLFDQIRRAVISVEANIVEGYALGTTPLFKRHLRISMGSAAEAECLLRVASEMAYLEAPVTSSLEEKAGAAMRALRGLLRADLSINPG